MDCQEVCQAKALFSPPSDDVYEVQIECGGKIALVLNAERLLDFMPNDLNNNSI